MSTKHVNPYKAGSQYGKLFAYMQKKQVYTREDLIAEAVRIGLSNEIKDGAHVSPAQATVTVMLSPRDEKHKGLRGDPRGNMSSRGDVYFNELLVRKANTKQRFRLRWRASVLERRKREATSVQQEKVKKPAKPAKKPAKKAEKATAEVVEG